MGNGPAKLLVGKGCTKRVVYDVLFMMCLSNVIDAETKFCSNSFLLFMSGKLILYYHITACEESIEFSVARI